MTTSRWLVLGLLACAGCKKDAAPPPPAGSERVLELRVTEEGFVPAELKVKKGEPLLLKVTRTTDKTCANEILIEGTDLNVPLPLNQVAEVRFTPAKTGSIKYGCAMGMMISGVFLVD